MGVAADRSAAEYRLPSLLYQQPGYRGGPACGRKGIMRPSTVRRSGAYRCRGSGVQLGSRTAGEKLLRKRSRSTIMKSIRVEMPDRIYEQIETLVREG